MPDVSLRFESLKLSCSAERIKLFVTSSATLRAQDEQFRRVRSHELLVLMESGKICTTRGPNCNLDFEFLFKNSQLNEVDKKTVIKEVGQFVLGAPVSSVCITTCLFSFTEGYDSGGHNSQSLLLSNLPTQVAPVWAQNFLSKYMTLCRICT